MSSIAAEAAPRSRPLRIAQYSVYPRRTRDHHVQEGFTRDEPGAAMVLVATAPATVGELLSVRIRGLLARDREDTLARVAACSEIEDSLFELRLEPLEVRVPRRVRGS